MTNSVINWLDSKELAVQLIVIDLIFFPLGILLGYLAHPYVGVEPVMGAGYGGVVGSIPVGLWLIRHQRKHS